MKKLSAISFIFLMLFNLIGYRMMIYCLAQQSDEQLQASFDKAIYDEDDLITVKIPLSNPYQISNTGFERVDGEVNFNSVVYKYVKRKVCNGELILLCIPDHHKMQLLAAKDNFAKHTGDIAGSQAAKKSEKSAPGFYKIFQSDFEDKANTGALHTLKNKSCYTSYYTVAKLVASPHHSPDQPPENALAV